MKDNSVEPKIFDPRSEREADIARTLGHKYHFIKPLGDSAFSSVFAVVNKSLDRVEALKVVSDDLTRQKDFLDRFKFEAKISACLAHPNIVTIYEYQKIKKFYFFTMLYVDGSQLNHFIDSSDRMPVHQICTNIATVCDAIEYAHNRGVIHRDLKPSNIMLDKSGKPYVTDFGIAKWEKALTQTQTGMIMGSPHYVSPEQAAGLEIDGRSDIYSLGITLYVLLTRQYPFDGDTPHLTIAKRLSQPPTPPETFVSDLHHGLIDILNKSLQKNRGDRYQTAAELAADLNDFANFQKGAGQGKAPASALSRKPPSLFHRRPTAKRQLITIIAVIVFVSTVPMFFFLKKNDVPDNHTLFTKQTDPPNTDSEKMFHKIEPLKASPKKQHHQELNLMMTAIEQYYQNGDFAACINAALVVQSAINQLPADQQGRYASLKETARIYQLKAAKVMQDIELPKSQAATSRLDNPPRQSVKDTIATGPPKDNKDKISKKRDHQNSSNEQQKFKKELKTLFDRVKEAYHKGNYEQCLEIANIALTKLNRLPVAYRVEFSQWKFEISQYKIKSAKKLTLQKHEQDLNLLTTKIDHQFRNGDFTTCLDTINIAISKIDSLEADQQEYFTEIRKKIADFQPKAEQAKQLKEQQHAVFETIKSKVAEGDLQEAISIIDTLMIQTHYPSDFHDTLRQHRKKIKKLMDHSS